MKLKKETKVLFRTHTIVSFQLEEYVNNTNVVQGSNIRNSCSEVAEETLPIFFAIERRGAPSKRSINTVSRFDRITAKHLHIFEIIFCG